MINTIHACLMAAALMLSWLLLAAVSPAPRVVPSVPYCTNPLNGPRYVPCAWLNAERRT